MRKNNTLNKLYLFSFLTYFTILILYSNASLNKTSFGNGIQIINFKLAGTTSNFLQNVIILLPYVVLLFLFIITFLYYSSFINGVNRRRVFRFFLLIAFIITFFYFLGPQTFNQSSQTTSPTPILTNTTTSTLTTTTTSRTPATFSESNPINTSNNKNINQLMQFNFLLASILTLFFLGILGLLFFIRTKLNSETTKNIPNPKQNFKTLEELDRFKNEIIVEYLKLSNILEKMGVNPDFSLTPFEFHDETQLNLNFNEFEIITYYYERARFSQNKITEEEYRLFQTNLKIIYDKISAYDFSTNKRLLDQG